MEKSICVKCIWSDRHYGHYGIYVDCKHKSNTYIATNYVTGKQTITFRSSCSDRNKFGNCRDFVEDLPLWRNLIKLLTEYISYVSIREKGEK